MSEQQNIQMIAKTFKGLEEVLAQELIALGANDIQIERRAVRFSGDKAVLYRANLCLRTASRVLVPIASFKAKDADAVYTQAREIDWSRYMTADTTFAIDATVYSDLMRNSRYVTYRLKDAIASNLNHDSCIRIFNGSALGCLIEKSGALQLVVNRFLHTNIIVESLDPKEIHFGLHIDINVSESAQFN